MDITNELIDFAVMLTAFVLALGIACAIQNWWHSRVPTTRDDLNYIARQRSKAMRRRARRKYSARF